MHVLRPVVLLTIALAACAPKLPAPDKIELTAASFSDLPGWTADSHAEMLPALGRSCGLPGGGVPKSPVGVKNTKAEWRAMCRALPRVKGGDHPAARAFIERWFVPYRVAGASGEDGLFTGYYEPQLRGALAPDARHRVPVYLRPPELVSVDLGEFRADLKGERIAGKVIRGRLKPFANRAAIENGALAGRGLELLWVDNPVDVFFLHIQGSGRIVLPDRRVIRVGYAGTNGHPYSAIGRELIARGAIPRDRVSMQTIRAWLAANPAEAGAMMQQNRSFIFFRKIDGDGPIGSQGVALTPGRSLAVDRHFIPLGLPLWLDTTDPLNPATPLRRLMIAQDTGGAIRGPVRGDVFWGHGPRAAARAGRMNARGRYFLLLPRPGAGRPLS